jgi:integrase/recombinase XerD
VYVRHSLDCLHQENPHWRRCNCRKWLYVYRDGKDSSRSAKTRSWEQAERVAQEIRDSWDPVKRKLAELEQRKRKEEAEAITIPDALTRWLASKKRQSSATALIYRTCARKIRDWATEKNLVFLYDITEDALDQWRGQWSLDAKRVDDRMSMTTQSAFLGHLRNFFGWAARLRLVERDPSVILDSIEGDSKKTLPLTPVQYEELLEATKQYDAGQRRECDRNGRELRAIFMVQRWSGLRIGDAAALPRRALAGNRLTLNMQKTGRPLTVVVPDCVVKTLDELPQRSGIHPDYFFWSRRCSTKSLSCTWTAKVAILRQYLNFKDEHGRPMTFRSHMLRDTFAVEMLLAGALLEDVSRMLGHSSVKITERYYSPWVRARQTQLEEKMAAAMERMGVTVSL